MLRWSSLQIAVLLITVVVTELNIHLARAICHFSSWDNPATPIDESFDTFMTLAYKFCARAETAGQGYRLPAQRLMRVLAVFNPDLRQQYDQQHNTPAADQFRATLLVTALSYAFQSDLRSEFRALRFPISDAVYDRLMGRVARMSGDGAGASSKRGFAKPASRNQSAISAKVKVSPASVCKSMLTAKISGMGGPVRSSFGTNSLMTMVPPGASAANVLRKSCRLRLRPSLWRM